MLIRHFPWACGVLAALAAAALLRLACLGAEFWLDEIWSWRLAQAAASPAGVFLVRHDNNHVLNTMWLSLWPATSPFALLRLHSLVAGVAAVALGSLVALRRGRAEAAFAAALLGGCSWLVLASAEARGYALAVCFALAAFAALSAYLDRGRLAHLLPFWLCSALGFLSHLTFVHAYLGFVVWSMRRFGRRSQDDPQKGSSLYEIRQLLACHGPVAAFFLCYYLVTVRGMQIGGGPPATPADVLRRLISLGLGGPAEGALGWLAVAFAAAVVVYGLRRLWLAGDDAWVFFATAIVGSPAVFLVRPPAMLFERYFLISFVFFLVLLAFVLGDLWRRRALRPLVAAAVCVFLAGNLWQAWTYAGSGRGEFEAALARVAELDADEVVPIGGNLADEYARFDYLRVEMYADFYARRRNESSRFVYLKADHSSQARWLFLQRSADAPRPLPDDVIKVGNDSFTLEQAYPARGRLDWGWYLYRRSGCETERGQASAR